MRLRIFLILVAIGLSSGCATASRYNGPQNATFSDFAQARTDCYRQLQAPTSSGSLNQYGASYSSGTTVSCGAFTGCLATKGYLKSQNGRFDSKGIVIHCSR